MFFHENHAGWIKDTAHADVNTRTHTHTRTLCHKHAHSTPELQRGEEPALQDNPAAHMRTTHMLGGLLNIPLMGEKTQDTGWGEK